ncbi:MAG: hypothetical protein MJ080_02955 [Clostridia bacterium]|nr:hypothetical protein [Clostridia bacterium]
MRFRDRLFRIINGRYGIDSLFYFLFGLAAVIALLNLFLRLFYLQIVVYLLSGFAVFRFFSNNYEARRKENEFFSKIFIKLSKLYNDFRVRNADKLHVYKKCPNCKATLRLPRKKGKHKTVCPKCKTEFSVRIWRN